jgi:NAD-reducing hydrogenase large subunit
MSKKVVFQKATRIEGNATIQIEIQDGRIDTARFMVHDFRAFEKFITDRRVEYVPHLVSRICGLCSVSHQVASLKAIEDALGVETPRTVEDLRQVALLAERLSSHALSYFFLTMPDLVGASGGVFELMKSHPDIAKEAFDLRNAGQQIVQLIGKKVVHPVSMGVGRFLVPPTAEEIESVRRLAVEIKERAARLIATAGKQNVRSKKSLFPFPAEQQVNYVAYDERPGKDLFHVYGRKGEMVTGFSRHEFEENVSDMRAEWTFAKFPYLSRFGFPAGIMMVGPLARSFQETGVLNDPALAEFELRAKLDRNGLQLEDYDICRLLEIYSAANTILSLLQDIDLGDMSAAVDFRASGQGIGVVEAPRGILVHSYLIKQGCIDRLRLLVATQFNNAFINLLIRDLAEKHLNGDKITPAGDKLIGRCVRVFDPCLSCATH